MRHACVDLRLIPIPVAGASVHIQGKSLEARSLRTPLLLPHLYDLSLRWCSRWRDGAMRHQVCWHFGHSLTARAISVKLSLPSRPASSCEAVPWRMAVLSFLSRVVKAELAHYYSFCPLLLTWWPARPQGVRHNNTSRSVVKERKLQSEEITNEKHNQRRWSPGDRHLEPRLDFQSRLLLDPDRTLVRRNVTLCNLLHSGGSYLRL